MKEISVNELYRALIGAAVFALLFTLERFFPLRQNTRSLIARLVVNVVISAGTFVVAVTLVRPATHWALHLSAEKPFGLVHVVYLPTWAEFALGFLMMDLAWYYWHLANHRVPVLWRFHNVHHIDPDLDVSTALRFHVGEVVLSAGFRVLQVSLIGLPPLTYMIYEGVFQASTLFQHSNIRLPLQVE